jgi:acetoin utilization protein AcuB
MRSPAVTVAGNLPVGAARELMRDRRIRHLPVLDGQGRLAGIVTDRDLRQVVRAPSLGGDSPLHGGPGDARLPTVEQVMTRDVVSAPPEMELIEAARLMHERKIGALPVVDAGGALIGVLAESDLVEALVQMLGDRSMPRWLASVLASRRVVHEEARREAERFLG